MKRAWLVGVVGACTLLHLPGCGSANSQWPAQCAADTDCHALGEQFLGWRCDSGACTPPVKCTGCLPPEGPYGCETDDECTAANGDRPAICPEPGKPCVPLATDDCTVVGDWKNPHRIFLGYALGLTSPNADEGRVASVLKSQATMAIEEIESVAHGIPSYTWDGTHSPVAAGRSSLVGVACDDGGDTTRMAENAKRLGNLFPVGALFAQGDARVTAMRTGIAQTHPNILFGVLGDSDLQAPSAYEFSATFGLPTLARPAALKLAELEANVRKTPGFSGDLRVAFVAVGAPDPATALEAELIFNGKTAAMNGANYMRIEFEGTAASVSALTAAIGTLKPHAVIFLGSATQASAAIGLAEVAVGGSVSPEYLVVAPGLLLPDQHLPKLAQNNEGLRKRVVGLQGIPIAQNPTGLGQFQAAYAKRFPGSPASASSVVYDLTYLATYAAAYGMHSVPDVAPSPVTMRDGIFEVVASTGSISPARQVGSEDLLAGLNELQTGSIALSGHTLSLKFDRSSGILAGSAPVWCITRDGATGTASITTSTGQAYDAIAKTMVGTFACP